MTASVQSPKSSVEEYAARRSRAVAAATDAGLSGILVTPGRTSSGSPGTSPRRSPNG